MSKRGPEGKIQDKVIEYAKSRGILHKKNEVGRYFVSSGWPDHNFYPGDGRVFFIEFKARGKDLTPLQEHRKKELTGMGYKVYRVDSVAYGRIVVDQECS